MSRKIIFQKKILSSNCLIGPPEWIHDNLVKKNCQMAQKSFLIVQNDEKIHFFSKMKYLPGYKYKQCNS